MRHTPANILFLTDAKIPKKNAANPISVIKGPTLPAIFEIPLASLIGLTISEDCKHRQRPDNHKPNSVGLYS